MGFVASVTMVGPWSDMAVSSRGPHANTGATAPTEGTVHGVYPSCSQEVLGTFSPEARQCHDLEVVPDPHERLLGVDGLPGRSENTTRQGTSLHTLLISSFDPVSRNPRNGLRHRPSIPRWPCRRTQVTSYADHGVTYTILASKSFLIVGEDLSPARRPRQMGQGT